MSSYRLINDGYATFKKIVHGRKWVGRVIKHATEPYYIGRIGNLSVTAATELEAFEEVVARHLGYANAATLKAKNRAVRQQQNAARAQVRRRTAPFRNALDRGDIKGAIDILGDILEQN